jgi:hypothetical protein
MSRKCIFHENLTRIAGTLHEDQYTFLIIPHSLLLRMRNVSDKSCRQNQNTHFTFNNVFFKRNRAIYEIMYKNTVELSRPQMKTQCMHIACWIPKATNTHSEYVNTSCIAIATMVAHTPLSVTLYVHCPSCFSLQDDSHFHYLDCCSVSLADFYTL